MAMVVAAAIFLRWLPGHGLFVLILVAISALSAAAISFTRSFRIVRAVQGINRERIVPDVSSTAAVSASVVLLAVMGIYVVLFLPPPS